jgi:hypothetical protein
VTHPRVLIHIRCEGGIHRGMHLEYQRIHTAQFEASFRRYDQVEQTGLDNRFQDDDASMP